MKLQEFVVNEKNESHPRCKTCALPDNIRNQVEAGRLSQSPPVSWQMISRWLATEGHSIHYMTLRNHFMSGHVK